MEEVWKPVKGYEGLYEVSSLGRIKSLERTTLAKNAKKSYVVKQRILKQAPNNQGYLTVNLAKEGNRKTFKIHAVVAAVFLGEKPHQEEVRHGVGGRLDNSVQNLSYGTHEDNERDKIRDKTSNHKFSAEEILEIRQIYREKQLNMRQLSILYDVDAGCIYKIVNYKSYKHVK